LDQCATTDRDGNTRVSVDELVAAVASALGDCRRQQTHAFIVTTNFVAGSFATVELEEPRMVSRSTSQRRIHNDATARVRNGLVYVVNRRFGDNIQVLDPAADFATRLQCSVGSGTNPHDIAFVSDTKAYVTLFEESTLLIINPAARLDCSDFVRGTIDLTALADDDGIPDMDLMAVAGNLLYVALQRLDIETLLRLPAGNGVIAVIDTTNDTVIDAIELSGENPFAATKGLTLRRGALYVAEAGLFGELDGGIERVDLARRQAEGFLVTEEDLGGDIVDFVLISDHLGYAIISRTDFNTALVAFDPAEGRVIDTLVSVDGFTLLDIEANDRGEIFLTDRQRERDGVRIFRAADGVELTAAPLDMGLAPFEVVFLP
jgi:DNA-binding beta-propeller fold protein YncE